MLIKLCEECGQEIQNEASYKAWREAARAPVADQPDELPRNLEDRVARIEKWIDFWETIETGWNAKATERESDEAPFIVLPSNESDAAVLHFFRAGFNIIINRPLPTTLIEVGTK